MTRGIRNHNPLNLTWRAQDNWKGLAGKDGRFCKFESDVYGFRAAIIVLRGYIVKYGRNTIPKIIEHWAPNSDGNNEEAYISVVCRRSGIDINKVLRAESKEDIVALVGAMAFVECGKVFENEIIKEAWELL